MAANPCRFYALWLLLAGGLAGLSSASCLAQCQFTVTKNNNNDHCLYARENVVWSKTGFSAGLTATGNSIQKTGGTDNWNTGAVSVNTVKNNGWATSTISETNQARFFGLSNADGGASFTTIQYGFYLRGDGQLEVFESGTQRINLGVYTTGQTLKIAVEQNVVKYYYNNLLKYVSAISPVLPLLVDVAFYNVNATVQSVQVYNGSDGTFTASAPAADLGTGPAYQWYLNGVAQAGETGSTYSNSALTAGDQLYCQLTPGAGGCSVAAVNSNLVVFQTEPASRFGIYGISATPATESCLMATEQATRFTLTNAAITDNDLIKNYGVASGSWDAGAFSTATVENNGYAQTTIAETNKTRAFGLSNADGGLHLNSIQFGFFLRADGIVEIYESGSNRFSTSYANGQVLKVAVEAGTVKYYRGTTLLYISAVAPTLPLRVDVSFQDMDATIQDVVIGNGISGTFQATATVTGAAPQYSWTRNGASVGTNSPTYTAGALLNGDQIQCTINPDRVGCSIATPVIALADRPYGGTFYISTNASTISCASTEEQIKPTTLVNATATGNTITKVQGGSGFWNAGATSLNQITDNGYAETTIQETNTTRTFGVSTAARALTQSSVAENTIQYGITFYGNGRFWVFELSADGTTYLSRGDFGSYTTGDVFSIKVDNGTVRYFQGTTNFYSSSISPTLPLVVDVSFNDVNATLANINVSNGSNGVFTAIAANAGTAPVYQWQVNSVNVGTNSSTYTNPSLIAGDVVTCWVTPDLPGCTSGQVSNNIVVEIIGGAASPTTTWTGAVSTAWENAANWSNGRPSGYLKATIPTGMPRYPTLASTAGVYDLQIQNGASLTISASNSLTVFNEWDNQGGFTANTSSVSLKNCTNNSNTLKVASGGNTFYNLTFDNANNLSIEGVHTVANQLTLSQGIATAGVPAAQITLADNATISGASSATYIATKVAKVGNDAFTFPIGKSGSYRPLTITAPTAVTDVFVAEYFHTGQTFGGPSTWPAEFWVVSGCEYWTLQRTAGTSTVQVTLSWRSAECDETLGPYVSDHSDLVVAGFDGTNWRNWGNTLSSGTTSGTVRSNATISSYFGPFTLASLSRDNVLPITLSHFEAAPLATGVALRWATESEIEFDGFVIERAGPDLSFEALASIQAKGSATQPTHYQWVDQRPLPGKNYYRLQMVERNATASFSDVVAVEAAPPARLRVFPNPLMRGQTLQVIGPGKRISVVDPVSMRTLFYTEETALLLQLKPGTYLVIDEFANVERLVVL